jgi:hypothetical protein
MSSLTGGDFSSEGDVPPRQALTEAGSSVVAIISSVVEPGHIRTRPRELSLDLEQTDDRYHDRACSGLRPISKQPRFAVDEAHAPRLCLAKPLRRTAR